MKEDNNFILTNKTNIEKKENSTEEEKEINDLKFLYQITGQNLKISNIKKDIGIFLELTDYIFNDIKVISDAGKRIKNYQNNSKLKINYESLYNNKVKCFNNNLDLFQKKLYFIKNKNIAFRNIFEYLRRIKEYGFLLDENFDINDNDMILDLDKFIIHHKWVKNFEELINIKNKNFKLVYEDNEKYNLKSDFYDYYNNKYILDFILEIKFSNYIVLINNDLFEKYIKDYLRKDIKTCENMELILFYIKYILYKFFKEEINSYRKYNKNDTKETFFQNNGLTFLIKRYPNNTSIKCNYLDNIGIKFSIIKIEKNSNKKYNLYSYYFNRMNNDVIKLNDFSFQNSQTINLTIEFTKIFLENILFDIKYSKNITNFVREIKRNNNLTLENIIKNSIFVKNLTNLGLILLKNYILKFMFFDNKIIILQFLSVHSTPIGKFEIYYEFLEKGMKAYYLIELILDNELNLSIFVKEPYKNMIFSLEPAQFIHVEKGRINYNYLYEIIFSVVKIIDKNNKFNYIRNNK